MRSQCPHPRLRQCARPTRAPTPHPRPWQSQPQTSFPDAWRRLKGGTSKTPCEGAQPQPPIRPHTRQRHRPPHHRRRQRRRLCRHPPRRHRHRRTRLRRHRRRLRHCRTPLGRGPPRHAPASAAAPVPQQELPPAPVPHLRGHKARLLIARPRSAAVHGRRGASIQISWASKSAASLVERRRPGPLPQAESAPTRGSATRLRRHGSDNSPRLPATSGGGRPRRVSASMRQLSPVAKSAARTAERHRLGPPQPGKAHPLARVQRSHARFPHMPSSVAGSAPLSNFPYVPDSIADSAPLSIPDVPSSVAGSALLSSNVRTRRVNNVDTEAPTAPTPTLYDSDAWLLPASPPSTLPTPLGVLLAAPRL